jgi:hypothetical protein
MAERGLRMPPTPSQRSMLWEIVDARPNDAAAWLREPPTGTKMSELVRHVLARWRALKDSIPPDPPRGPICSCGQPKKRGANGGWGCTNPDHKPGDRELATVSPLAAAGS